MPLLETRGSGSASAYGFGGGFEPFAATFVSLFGSTPSRTAPTTLGSYYNGTQLQGRVTLSSGKQLWTVQNSGLYKIKAFGAQGGSGSLSGLRGGGGASVEGLFQLTAGEVVQVLVGSPGGYRSDSNYTSGDGCDSGGGGGTYVVKSPYNTQQSVLLIAAGGGGSSNRSFFKSPLSSAQGNGDRSILTIDGTYGGASGMDGQGGTAGVNGARSLAGVNGFAGGFRDATGTPNNGSQSGLTQGGNGGGGFFSGGNSGRSNDGWAETSYGWSYLDGSNGGTSAVDLSWGGFGGGGGGHGGCYISGGGGGGWNGGGNQWQYWNRHGGCGGGSLNNGLNPVNVSGANYDSTGVGAFGRVEVLRVG